MNIPVFDYKGTLRSGEHKLYMWPIADEDILTEELLNPIGTSRSLLSRLDLGPGSWFRGILTIGRLFFCFSLALGLQC